MESTNRIEALSDAIFGLALTFLVVKMEIPKNYAEFESMSHGFVGFFVTFIMLFIIWNNQGRTLNAITHVDAVFKLLTACFLFTILFFVFPLKYLFTMSVEILLPMTNVEHSIIETLSLSQIKQLIQTFSQSIIAIFGLLMLMHIYIFFNQGKLILCHPEAFVKREIFMDAVIIILASLSYSLVIISTPEYLYFTGLIYTLIVPCRFVIYQYYKKSIN